MKAHEETWIREDGGVVIDTSGNMVAEVYGRPDTGNSMMVERTLLISAAPDMARALLYAHDDLCDCESGSAWQCHIRIALKKAGIP